MCSIRLHQSCCPVFCMSEALFPTKDKCCCSLFHQRIPPWKTEMGSLLLAQDLEHEAFSLFRIHSSSPTWFYKIVAHFKITLYGCCWFTSFFLLLHAFLMCSSAWCAQSACLWRFADLAATHTPGVLEHVPCVLLATFVSLSLGRMGGLTDRWTGGQTDCGQTHTSEKLISTLLPKADLL